MCCKSSATIDQQGMAAPRRGAGDLIKVAAAHTGKAAFGALCQQGNLDRGPVQPGRREQRMGQRDFETGR